MALILLVTAPAAKAQFSTRCSQDHWGNITCTGSDGSRLRQSTDFFGNTRTNVETPYGRSTCRSSRDFFGNFTTTCY